MERIKLVEGKRDTEGDVREGMRGQNIVDRRLDMVRKKRTRKNGKR